MRDKTNIINERDQDSRNTVPQDRDYERATMEILIFGMVLATVGIAAAALGGIFAIYASRQD